MAKHEVTQVEEIKASLTHREYRVRGSRSFLFMLVSGGGAISTMDGGGTRLPAPFLVWTPVGRTARVMIRAGTRGVIPRIPETVLGRALPRGSESGHVCHAIGGDVVCTGLGARRLTRLEILFDQIAEEIGGNAPGAATVVDHCISLLLLQLWRCSSPRVEAPAVLSSQLVHDFFNLVEVHLFEHWTITDHAAHLGVSRDRLNSAVRRAVDLSPHRHVRKRLMDEARKLLVHSDYHVAEIGYRLGFSDPACFNRFFQRHFQRHAHMPPGRFREMHVDESLSEQVGATHAAWP